MKKLILAALLASSAATFSIPASAEIYVNIAPPAPRYEVVPAPRHGYVWAPGYWDWRHGRYHWVAGHYVRHRPGHYYEPVRWAYHDGRYYRSGGWRDSDGDGVPNRYDHAPLNPYYR